MEEITQEVVEPTYKTMYAKLNSIEEYEALNEALGAIKNYPDERSDTFWYSTPEPQAIEGIFYMAITSEIQMNYPSVLEGLTLVDSIPSVEVVEPIEPITE